MNDIPILNFTTDSQGNVSYTNAPKPAATATGPKWWEQVIGVVPALVTAIFGNNAQAQQPVYTTTPYPQTNSGSNSTLIIVAIAIVVVFLVMKKK